MERPPAYEDDWPRPDPPSDAQHSSERTPELSAEPGPGESGEYEEEWEDWDDWDDPEDREDRDDPEDRSDTAFARAPRARARPRRPPPRGRNGRPPRNVQRSRRLTLLIALVLLVVVIAWVVGSSTSSSAKRATDPKAASARSSSTSDPASSSQVVDVDGGIELDPSYFETGSCVAFAPTSGDRHQTVFVDAGHGGIDPGAVGTTETGKTIYEADQTLPVELDISRLLRAQGYRVVVSRTGPTTVIRPQPGDVTGGEFTLKGDLLDVAARDVCANMAKANLLVGIYFDAGTSPTDAGSIAAYDATRPFSADNLKFATLLQDDVLVHLNSHGWNVPNDGVQSDVTLGGPPLTTNAASYSHLVLLGPADPGYFTTPSKMPGALIEPLFITDPYEGSIAASTAGHQAIADGMAQAVEQYLQESTSTSKPVSTASHATKPVASKKSG